MGRWLRRPLNVFALLLAMLPVALTLLIIDAYLLRQTPYVDQWSLGVYIATRAKAGTLSFGDLAIQYGTHHIIFSNLTTAFFARAIDWDLTRTIYVQPVLAGVRWGLLVWLLAKQKPALIAPGLVLFALFVFYPTQLHLWEYSFNTPWLFVQIFFLLGLLTITSGAVNWLRLVGAAVFALCATFSIAVGLVSWVIYPVVLWLSGYRRWTYGVFWLAAMAAGLFLFFAPITPLYTPLERLLPDFSGGTALASVDLVVMGAFIYLTASVLFVNLTWAVGLGLVGLGMLAVNVWVVWRRSLLTPRQLAVWLALAAYAVGGAVLTMLGRTAALHPIDAGKQTRYFNVSVNLWLALLTLGLVIFAARGSKRWLRYANLFVGVFVVLSLLLTSTQTMGYLRGVYGHGLFDAPRYPNAASDACVVAFPLTRDASCLPTLYDSDAHSQPEFIYQLAVYRLAIFADYPAVMALPDAYVPGQPVIVSTPSEWLNLYAREFMLPADAPALHLTAPAIWDDAAAYSPPLANVLRNPTLDDAPAVRDFIDGVDVVWYLTTPETAAYDDVVFAAATDAGYTVNIDAITSPRYDGAAFLLYRLSR